ncbi:MAG: DUF2382 domain-containing protein [Sphingomicrobium sp.]
MSRLVTALYDTRAEAETARARLAAEAGADHGRIIGRDDGAELERLHLPADDDRGYRDAIAGGAFMLVADVPDGEQPDRIVELLEQSTRTELGSRPLGSSPSAAMPITGSPPSVLSEGGLRVGDVSLERGGARVRTLEPSADRLMTSADDDTHSSFSGRQLTSDEVEAAGLLKERVIEVSEMHEEPVLTKSVFVREELLLKKNISERIETIHDTLRHTEVEVEDRRAGRESDRT